MTMIADLAEHIAMTDPGALRSTTATSNAMLAMGESAEAASDWTDEVRERGREILNRYQ